MYFWTDFLTFIQWIYMLSIVRPIMQKCSKCIRNYPVTVMTTQQVSLNIRDRKRPSWASITHCINPTYSLHALRTLSGQECDEWWDAAVGSSAISHLYQKPPHQEERATNRTYNSGSSTHQQLDKSENRRKAGLWLKQTEKAEHTVPFTMWVASRFYKILRCFHDSCEIILLIMTCLCM